MMLATLLLTTLAVAGDADEPPRFDDVFKVFGPKVDEAHCPTCAAGAPDWSACMRAVCPSDAAHRTESDIVDAFVAAAGKQDVKAILDDTASWVLDELRQRGSEVQGMSELIANKNFHVDPAFGAMHDAVLPLTFLPAAVIKGVNADGSYEIDREKTASTLTGVPSGQRDWLLDSLAGYYREPLMGEVLEVAAGSAPVAFHLSKKYPGLPLGEALKKESARVSAFIADLESKVSGPLGLPPLVWKSMYRKDLLAEAASGTMPDDKSLESFYEDAKVIELIHGVLVSPREHPWFKRRKPGQLDEVVRSPVLKANVGKLAAFLKDDAAVRRLGTTVVGNCSSALALAKSVLPTSDELANGAGMVADVKRAVRDKFLSRLSVMTGATVGVQIAKVEAHFPQTPAQFEAMLVKERHAREKALGEEAEFLARAKPEVLQQGRALDIDAYADPAFDPEKYLLDEFDYCKRLIPVLSFSDAARADAGTYWVSWLSLKEPAIGKSVMAHELGHLVDHELRTGFVSEESGKKLTEARECLGRMHPDALAPGPEGKTADKFQGEDFADLVAATTFPGRNVACALWSPATEPYSKLSPASPTDDPNFHSSTLSRALHAERIGKGPLPAACRAQLLKLQPAAPAFERCL
ncbi:MAG: hypothetical protein HY075_12635 [Deltaproteobacteria bacterium]|nr:hypothetical protein [Deltaproteobacteria bacterium]